MKHMRWIMRKKEAMPIMYIVADILNIQVTRKNKNIQENSRGNPIMIGVNRPQLKSTQVFLWMPVIH